MKSIPYNCDHCVKQFIKEETFLAHKCDYMVRKEELTTKTGQSAFRCYKTWIKMKTRSSILTPDSFLRSRFYKSLMAFSIFCQEVEIVDIDIYIKLMIRSKYSPQIWIHDIVYVQYLQHLDNKVSPFTLVEISIKNIDMFCDALQCPPSKLFNTLHPNEILMLIRSRRLSPWILLKSKTFIAMLNRLSQDHRTLFDKLINATFWREQFRNHPSVSKEIAVIVKALDI